MAIQDWPKFEQGKHFYVMGWGSGEEEDVPYPIGRTINRTRKIAIDRAHAEWEISIIEATPDEDWIDALRVYEGRDPEAKEVARYDLHAKQWIEL